MRKGPCLDDEGIAFISVYIPSSTLEEDSSLGCRKWCEDFQDVGYNGYEYSSQKDGGNEW